MDRDLIFCWILAKEFMELAEIPAAGSDTIRHCSDDSEV